MGLNPTRAEFESTHWSLIAHLRDGDDSARREALARLAETYWPAVYGFLRRRGLGREAAEETTQAFFAEVVVGRSLFDGAAPERGRLRSLMLSALRNFRVDQSRRRGARGEGVTVRLDPSRVMREEQVLSRDGHGGGDADSEFDRQWAAAVVEEALRRCRGHFENADKARHWALFEERIVAPSVRFTAPPPLAEAARRLGWANPADAAAAVQVVKKRFDAILREVVGETTEGDAEDEYRHVLGRLS